MTLGELFKASGYVIDIPEALGSKKITFSDEIDVKSKAFKRWLLKPSKGLANVKNLINDFDNKLHVSISLKRFDGSFLFELV